MSANSIRKTRGIVLRANGQKMGFVARSPCWYAICPACSQKVPGRQRLFYGRGDGGSSRKLAKDALYDHQRSECEQGRVETAPS